MESIVDYHRRRAGEEAAYAEIAKDAATGALHRRLGQLHHNAALAGGHRLRMASDAKMPASAAG